MRLDVSSVRTNRRPSPTLSRILRGVAMALLAVALTGCQVAKSAFANEADKVGSNFAAAATTLQYLHEGKLTRQYARAAFVAYASVTQGADASLKTAPGAPDVIALNRLLRLYQPAAQAIAEPCLDSSCDWQRQVSDLHRASDAFNQAAQA